MIHMIQSSWEIGTKNTVQNELILELISHVD